MPKEFGGVQKTVENFGTGWRVFQLFHNAGGKTGFGAQGLIKAKGLGHAAKIAGQPLNRGRKGAALFLQTVYREKGPLCVR